MSGIVLSSAVRSNLITLQSTADLQAKVQERLSTGKKVNSALDNPTNFFTAAGLGRRANDLSALLDGMSQGIKTLEAADNSMKAITKTVESMQANIRQARQDKSFKGVSYNIDAATVTASGPVKNLTISGGAVGTTPVDVALNTAATPATLNGGAFTAMDVGHAGSVTIQATGLNGGTAVSVALNAVNADTAQHTADAINTALDAATGGDGGITATVSAGKLVLTGASGNNITIADAAGNTNGTLAQVGLSAGTSSDGVLSVAKTVDQLVTAINGNSSLSDKVKASNDGGKLRIDNLSTEALTVVGASSTSVNGGTGNSNTQTIGGNDVRKNLMGQFNDLRRQLDKLAGDGSYNGINLVRGDKLKISFNETGTSSIDIQAKDTAGAVRGIGTEGTSLNIGAADATEFSSDANLDTRLDHLNDSLTTLQTQSSSFGAALTTVQNRQDFTKAMINTLQQGADGLTLADSNEEGANLLALNTRQQLSQTALSLASQASQAVLRLF
jgi:flagellin-like hook-associated protein FlgL